VLGGALLAALLLWLLYRWPWYLVAPPSRQSEGTDLGTGPPESAASRPDPTHR